MIYFNDILQLILFTGAAFALLVLLASHLRFQQMTRRAQEGGGEPGAPAEPLAVHVAHLLGTAHRVPDPFCLFLIEPLAPPADAQDAGALLGRTEKTLRAALRAGDQVVRYGTARLGLVCMIPREKAERLATRLLHLVQARGGAPVLMGIATHPENGEKTQALFEAAIQALNTAREKAGGNSAWAPAPRPAAEAPLAKTAAGKAPAETKRLLDELTGVLREDRVGPVVQKYLARLRRQEQAVSFLVVDVDHLARYNEHYGEETGDAILRELAELLQHGLREDDLIGRYQGDSFLVVMKCSAAHGLQAAQRLAAEVRRKAFSAGGGSLRVTVSIGLAGYPEHGAHPARLLQAAEAALAASKKHGNNRCLLFDSSLLPERPDPGRPPVDTF